MMPSFIEAKHEERGHEGMDTWTPAVGKAPAEHASAFFVRVDIYNNANAEKDAQIDTVTAQLDTAKEIIKEFVEEFDDLDDVLGLSVKERDLLARAKELLK